MKKTYKNPILTVVKIQPAQLLTESIINIGESYNGTSSVEAREAIFSDDEWIEE